MLGFLGSTQPTQSVFFYKMSGSIFNSLSLAAKRSPILTCIFQQGFKGFKGIPANVILYKTVLCSAVIDSRGI